MNPPRPAFEYQVPDGPRVVLGVLAVTEILTAMKAAGAEAGPVTIHMECMRHSLREVDGKKVVYTDLAGKQLDTRIPRSRHQLAIRQAWSRLHEPTMDETDAMKASLACIQELEGESWTVRLPGDRTVRLAELRPTTIDLALKRARQAGRSESLQQLAATVESLRMAVVEIDGRGVSSAELDGKGWDKVFSMKETLLLGAAWQEAYSLPEMGTMGELKPVSGTL